MRWPIWSQTTEEQKPMWNAELVAKLESERAGGLPRRTPTITKDTPEEMAKRRQLAAEIARKSVR